MIDKYFKKGKRTVVYVRSIRNKMPLIYNTTEVNSISGIIPTTDLHSRIEREYTEISRTEFNQRVTEVLNEII